MVGGIFNKIICVVCELQNYTEVLICFHAHVMITVVKIICVNVYDKHAVQIKIIDNNN